MDKKEQAKKAVGILLTIVLVILGLVLIGSLLQLFTAGAIWPWLSSSSETFRNYALIIGGGYGIVIALRRADAHDKQAQSSLEQNELAMKTLKNDLFSRAIEQLSLESLTTKNAGINSLHSLALNDRANYSQLVADTLGSYIREKTIDTGIIIKEGDDVTNAVHTLLKLISKKPNYILEDVKLYRSELLEIDFSGYNLKEGVNFDITKFNGCGFGGRTVLPSLIKRAEFHHCVFSGYLCSPSLTFQGGKFINTQFNNVDLSSIFFSECGFLNTTFNDCWGIDLFTFERCKGLDSIRINDMTYTEYLKIVDH